ncbi:Helicase associated domain protein [Mycobacterium sp. NPDC050551]|uniref:DEAD/DEAH box helicase n=1 Tax=Mycobacterium sp. NPDC050551 TaxID=3155407 RepID=UPI0034252C46
MGALQELLSQLDPAPGRRGKQFERICKWFLTHDPRYTHLHQVWLWEEWPGRWGADTGIDLIAEDHEGRLWAIQAKAYDPAYSVTKRDVDTFLSEAGRPQISFRLLIATTDRIGHNAKRTLDAQEKKASFLGLAGLEAAQVNWPDSASDLRASQPPPKQPRDHQREAIDKVVEGFEQSDRGQMIMACGTGKTLTALFIKEKLAAPRTLVLMPSLSLLAQTLCEWRANKQLEFDFLPVCSDETVTDRDAVVGHTSDLGLPVTTDPWRIAEFLRRRSRELVVFATYQSSLRIAEAFRLGRVPAFDLVIADEAHRCAGRVSSEFGTVLDSEMIRARRRLFMTATPRYFTGRVMREAKEAIFEVASMDNDATFGPVFHRLAFGEAIERNLLTDYQVAVVGVDDATYRDWAQRGRFVTLDGTEVTDARTLAGQIGLAKAMRRYDLHRIITFHSRVKSAREFARDLPEVTAWMPARQRPTGHLWSDYASGEMSAGERNVRLQRLAKLRDGERGLLANARCLAEGVDVPTLDGVAFIDPRRSEVDIVQAVGRAIRLAPDKTVGTVVIPVFIDTNEDPETALDGSAFKPVWDVIKALRSHDDELGEHLDALRRQLGLPGGKPTLPEKIIFDVPARVSVDFARAFNVRLVEQTTASWEFWFGLLSNYVKEHGNALVPSPYEVDGHRLGRWVTQQRSDRTEAILPLDREQRLQNMTGWEWNARVAKWEANFALLMDYLKEHGDVRIPQNHKLDGWVAEQRTRYARNLLEPDRVRRLEELGDRGWVWNVIAAQWEANFRRLLEYIELNRNARVPDDYVVDGYALGAWVQKQRRSRKSGRLDADYQRRLDELSVQGWSWAPKADQWELNFDLLLEYVKLNDHARIKKSDTFNGFPLGTWAAVQRRRYAKGALESDRVRRLEGLIDRGWKWDARPDSWEEGFDHLLRYIEQHGHARLRAQDTFDGYPLGKWASHQRNFYSKGTLESDRVRRLEELTDRGWAWNVLATRWEEGFSRLLQHIEADGDATIRAKYKMSDGYPLGQWVSVQRVARARGTLDAARQSRLQHLPGWTWKASSP